MALDHRLYAARHDLADIRLKGRVEAEEFVEGRHARVREALAAVRRAPAHYAPMDTELLRGEPVRVFEVTDEGWAWVQSQRDGYVGWCAENALDFNAPATTHRVIALSIHLYPSPDIRVSPVGEATLNAELAIAERSDAGQTDDASADDAAGGAAADEERFLPVADGTWAVARHIAPRELAVGDFVEVARRFIGMPYLWAGRSARGLDCSGLIQMALHAAGRGCLRDSDMQEKTHGEPVTNRDPSAWRRGDLVFWPGHAGIVSAPGKLLHANAHHMQVVEEPLIPAIDRIAKAGLDVSNVRRLPE